MTDKEFNLLLELSAFYVEESERAMFMGDVEGILGYVSQLPASPAPRGEGSSLGEDGEVGACMAQDARPDEIHMPDPKEIKAVRAAFPVQSSEGLLEVHDVFGSKDL